MRNLQKAKEIQETAEAESLPLHVIQLDVTNDESIAKAINRDIICTLLLKNLLYEYCASFAAQMG
jgi:hypothetical protein